MISEGAFWAQVSAAAATSQCHSYQRGSCCSPLIRHTLIAEGPAGSVTTIELFTDDPAEVFRIGRELFPGRRLAAVNHEDEDNVDPAI